MRTATLKSGSRTKAPEARREELMDAAQRLFLSQGVASTSIEQITSGANVAKGTFYLYFSSKNDIIAALGDRFSQELLLGIVGAVDAVPRKNWKGKLEAWASAAIAGYLDAIELHDIVFRESHVGDPHGMVVDNPIIEHLTKLLEDGAEAGSWRIDDAHFTAVFLFSGLHGIVDDVRASAKRASRSRITQKLQQLCVRVVG